MLAISSFTIIVGTHLNDFRVDPGTDDELLPVHAHPEVLAEAPGGRRVLQAVERTQEADGRILKKSSWYVVNVQNIAS